MSKWGGLGGGRKRGKKLEGVDRYRFASSVKHPEEIGLVAPPRERRYKAPPVSAKKQARS